MTTRTITGNILKIDGSAYSTWAVEFILTDQLVTATDVYTRNWKYQVVTASSGSFTADLPVPDTGTTEYLINIVDGRQVYVNLGAGPATDLQTLIEVSVSAGQQSALQTIMDAHKAAADPHAQYITKALAATSYDVINAALNRVTAHANQHNPHANMLGDPDFIASLIALIDEYHNADGWQVSTAQLASVIIDTTGYVFRLAAYLAAYGYMYKKFVQPAGDYVLYLRHKNGSGGVGIVSVSATAGEWPGDTHEDLNSGPWAGHVLTFTTAYPDPFINLWVIGADGSTVYFDDVKMMSPHFENFIPATFEKSLWPNHYQPVINPVTNVAGDVCIFWDENYGCYVAYYNDNGIYRATSNDGVTWSVGVELGVYTHLPSVVYHNSLYYLFSTGGSDTICLHTSPNGITNWTQANGGNPIITATVSFEQEGYAAVRNPWVRWDDTNHRFEMVYACSTIISPGHDANGEPKKMALAVSSDGVTWVKAGIILSPSGAPGDWRELGALIFPVEREGRWLGVGSGLTADHTYVGTYDSGGADWGIPFTENTGNPIIDPADITGLWAETYTINHAYAPRWIRVGDQERIYFNGGTYGHERIGFCYRLPVDRTAWFARQYVNGALFETVYDGLKITGNGGDSSFAFLENLSQAVAIGDIVTTRGYALVVDDGNLSVPLRFGIGDRVSGDSASNRYEYFICYDSWAHAWKAQKRINGAWGTEQVVYATPITANTDYIMSIKRVSGGAELKLYTDALVQLGSTVTFSGDAGANAIDLYTRLGNRGLGSGVYKYVDIT